MGVTDLHTTDDKLVGRPVKLLNAERFVEGRGRYVDDVHLPGERHVTILRSTQAHARIVAIDVSRALALEGVEHVVTGADVLDTEPQLFLWNVAGQKNADTRCLAHGTVRWIGEPVAAVVATDPYVAEDALDLIEVEYEPLPVLGSTDEALADDAIRLHEGWDDNVASRTVWTNGDVEAGLAEAAVVVRHTFDVGRVTAASLEGRGVVVEYDAAGPSITLWTSTQGIHHVREAVGRALRMPEHRIRVRLPDVGGAFGAKGTAYTEETLLAWLAVRFRKNVRWIEDRRESFLATVHARAQRVDVEMGFRADGTVCAMRAQTVLDMGGAPSPTSAGSAWATGALMTGPYQIECVEVVAMGVVTNKVPIGGYRGFGQPEAYFPLERTMDLGAAALGMDPAEVRRRNMVPQELMPYATPGGYVLDSGDYRRLFDLTLERFGYDGVREEIAAAAAEGRRLGVGVAFYAEHTNLGPSGALPLIGIEASGFDTSIVRVEPSGHVTVISSQSPMGQGVETVLAQVCADELGVPLESVAVAYGDTQSAPYTGYTSGGSRGAGIAGSSALIAARRAKAKMIRIAAHLLEASEEDVELVDGGFAVRGAPTSRLPFAQVARAGYIAASWPEGMEPGIEATCAYDPPAMAASFGAVAVLVEVDEDTGEVEILRMVLGHDCGPQLNPAIVEGQVVGGIAQGIGTALYESLDYGPAGEPLVTTLADYGVPSALMLPDGIELLHTETPTPFAENGVKGVGESGVIAVPAAVVNAVQDALGPGAPPIVAQPVRPEWILEALERA